MMESRTQTFELQIDHKPNGLVIRVNDDHKCVLRICNIPQELIIDPKNGKVREFIDITYPTAEPTKKSLLDEGWLIVSITAQYVTMSNGFSLKGEFCFLLERDAQ